MTTPAGERLQPDEMHDVHPRAAGLDVHKVVDRNAARWLRKLKEHGYIEHARSGSQSAAA